MRHDTRQRLHLDLADLPVLPARMRPLPVAFPRVRANRDNVGHTRELRHTRRAVRQQLHDLERSDPTSRADWQPEE